VSELIHVIREAWNWIGIDPEEVVAENDFGNLIVRATDGQYWRICPEHLSCEIIAESRPHLDAINETQNFRRDWWMKPIVDDAIRLLGPLSPGRKFCLKMPAVLGGSYDPSNFSTLSLLELISFSGETARQVKDLPDGAEVNIKIIE
jgi:hypothetical protein